MKISKGQLKNLIKSVLNESKLSKSEKETIRLNVQIELGEEFEKKAAQAKTLEEYDMLEASFNMRVQIETQRRIKAAELEASGFPEPKPFKVKIDDRSSWDSSWQQLDRQELATTRQQANRQSFEDSPTIDITPGFDGDNSHLNPPGPTLSQAEINRRDFLKAALAGTAAAGSAGVFDPLLGDTGSLPDSGLEKLEIEEVISQWLDWFIASGQLDEAYRDIILDADWLEMWGTRSLEGNAEEVVNYIMDFSPEELYEPMGSYYERHGYFDPWEFEGAVDKNGNKFYPDGTSSRLNDIIRKKLEDHYTPEKIKEIMRYHGQY